LKQNNTKFRCRVPLRISFGGGGTDVPPYATTFGGAVIGSTINKYAYSTLIPNKTDKSKTIIKSQDFDLTTILDFKAKFFDKSYRGKTNLAKAVINVMKPKKLGFEILTTCDAPPGTGLASSTAVITSMVGSLKSFIDISLTSYEIAELVYEIERKELAIKGGLQDQYACTFGGFYFIEFKNNEVIVNPLRIKREIVQELESNLLLVDTGVPRSSSKIHSIQSKKYSEDSVIKTLDTLKEQAYELKTHILKGNLKKFGETLHSSWETKKQISEIISSRRIDSIYDEARNSGAIGGKVLGAGGGGHMVFYIENENRRNLEKTLTKMKCKVIPFNFENSGLQTWSVDGNHIHS